MRERYPFYLANRAASGGAEIEVLDKAAAAGRVAARVVRADAAAVERALAAGRAAVPAMGRVPAYQRRDVLLHVVEQLGVRAAEFQEALIVEAGKTIRDARGEHQRAMDTFRLAAEAATRIGGEFQPLDISARAAGAACVWRRFPVGLCSFITPFNFPLNLVAHKIAPAIACGCPWVLKPALRTPISALLLGEILAGLDLPEGAFSVLPCEHDDATPLVEDERIKLLSFTGSTAVGWQLKARAGKKRVALELGGNAACIVDETADLARAAERIPFGAFYGNGQSCISVQRILIHRSHYDTLRARLVSAARALPAGELRDERTFLGPLISEDDARRIEAWIAEAVAGGARVLCGGGRKGAFFEATLLENVDPRSKVSCQEVFGPVATLTAFDSFAEALQIANASTYGLQAGVFTNSLRHAWQAFGELEVGGVVINDVPSFRVDSMPYGGTKDSGVGREGVDFAIEEFTEIKALILTNLERV